MLMECTKLSISKEFQFFVNLYRVYYKSTRLNVGYFLIRLVSMSTECTWTHCDFSASCIFTEYPVQFIQKDYNPNVQLVSSIASLII